MAVLAAIGIGVIYGLFVYIPSNTEIKSSTVIQLVSTFGFAAFFFRGQVKSVVTDLLGGYDVAELELRGPIQEKNESGFGSQDVIDSKGVVKQLEKLEKRNFDALILNISTPGGSPVPSDDIRRKLEEIDLPVYTYTTEMLASGGYMLGCGTDWIHARTDSLVGSIGVIGSQQKFHGLGDKLGVDLERFVGGEMKDTHRPLKEISEEERDYWQNVIDHSYENFTEIVAGSRELSVDEVKDTEARIFHAVEAHEKGLVDSIGPREVLHRKIGSDLGISDIKTKKYESGDYVLGGIGTLIQSVAYSFGKGLGSAVSFSEDKKLEHRV
jgi:protease-4